MSRIGRFFENRQLERNAKRWILFLLSIRLVRLLLLALFWNEVFTVLTGITTGIRVAAEIFLLIWYRRLIRDAQDSIRAAQAASLESDSV